jgi:predicted Zn finger-like uncharacterized protein
VKFLCDRCKTRYSIGDERVRGKILKIRCKNCANVITVREGMGAEGDGGDPGRRKAPTTNAPLAQTAASSGALSAAFASQMAKPPPALEEEWYVSIDGNQAGPFSLAEAQRWVAAKPFEAELHCWSEGFDDWLPVDKVSHFRGLRKRPLPAPAPPPLPRVAPRFAPVEDTPKPLFAATMAALEKGSGPARAPAAVAPMPSAKSNGTPAMPVSAKGTASGPSVGAKGTAPAAPIGAITPASAKTPPRGGTVQGVGGAAIGPGAKALAAAFDVHEDDRDSMTQVEAPPFAMSTPEPRGMRPDAVMPPLDHTVPLDFNDDNLEIGEVSRVVNLADLAKNMGRAAPPQRKSAPRQPMMRGTGPMQRISAAELGGGAGAALLPGAMVGDPVPSESIVAQAPVAASRRGMVILLVAAGVLLSGLLVAVLLIASGGDEDGSSSGSLREARKIETDRPEDIVRKIASQAAGSGAPGTNGPRGTGRPRYTGQRVATNPGTPDEVADPTKRELEADEVQDMAAKQSDGTGFCYKRAQRGALGIEIQDLKRMDVVLTVDREGGVQGVQLSSHATDALGVCLASRIRGWKFRQSSGTKAFKITLVFSNG